MSPPPLAEELRRLADEARAARERLGELGRQLAELVAALPAPEDKPREPEAQAETQDDGPRLQSIP